VVARINSNILYLSIKKTITLNNKNGAETNNKYIDRFNMFSILSEVLRGYFWCKRESYFALIVFHISRVFSNDLNIPNIILDVDLPKHNPETNFIFHV